MAKVLKLITLSILAVSAVTLAVMLFQFKLFPILGAIVPGAFWVWFFCFKSRAAVCKMQILKAFFLGVLVTLPTSLLGNLLTTFLPNMEHSELLLLRVVFYFLVAGLLEEGAKFWAAQRVFNKADQNLDLNSVMALSAASCLGFAILENIFYLSKGGIVLLIVRTLLSVPSHVLFSAPLLKALSAKDYEKNQKFAFLPGFLLSAFFHGLFDGLCDSSLLLVVILAIALWNQYNKVSAEANQLAKAGVADSLEPVATPAPSPVLSTGLKSPDNKKSQSVKVISIFGGPVPAVSGNGPRQFVLRKAC